MSRPRAKDAANGPEQIGQIGGLPFQKGAHIGAWHRPSAALARDSGDFPEREAEPSSLSNKVQQPQHISWIEPVARHGSSGARKDALRLVQAQSLAADPTTLRYLTDEQVIASHDRRIDPAVRGKVKDYVGESN
jgi:hypothetical protein